MPFIPVVAKQKFESLNLNSSLSQDSSEIIIMCCFTVQYISISIIIINVENSCAA